MKSTLLILLTMLLQIIFCNNLFLNGGFEEGKENKADAWSSGVWAGSDSIHYRSDKDAVNGKFCYYLEKRDSKGGLQLYSDKEINLPLPEYKESIIEISGAYKGNKTSITLQFRFYRVENGKMITLINSLKQYDCFNVKMNPSSGWKRFSQIISVPEQAKSHSSIIMRPYILLSQADSLFIDDLSLTARLKADSAVSQSTDDKYNLLENSGFEEGSGDKADDWSSGPWGGAKTVYKRSSTEKASGNFSYFLEKLDNQGGIQLFYNKYITLAGIDKNKYKVIVSGKYLGNKKTVYFQARLYKKEGDKIISLIDEKQKQISCKADLTPAGQWQAFSRELVLPAVTAGTGDIFLKPYIIFFNADSIYLDELAIHITRNGEPVLRISRQEIPADPLNGNFSRWKVAPIEPLSENEKKSYSPISLPNISFTVKDGNILKNGKPYFLIGTPTAGGGQWNSQTIWYPRVFKYDFVEKYDSVSRAMKVAVDENKNLNIAWNNAAWSFSHIRELYRNNIFVWMDIGTSDYKYLTQLTSHQDEFPEMKMLMQQRYGHFYPFDHANSFGRQLYQGAWSSYLRYYGNVQFLSLEIFNELGYSCSSPLTQNAFRNYLLQKYKSLPEINKVFTTSFRDKNDIIAPHLRENFSEYYQYKLNLEKSRAENFSLYNEWLEFLKIFLVENMRPLKKSVAAISKNNISIDARHELHEFDQYCTSDPELISEISDIYDFHLGPPLFFNYNNRPAQASDVLQSVICAGFYLDYIRSIIDKPIVNPECIISGTKPPQANEKFIIDNSLVNLHSKWKFSTDPGKKGMEQEWFKPGYNDASWDELEVPGMWEDLDSKYKTYDGWAWYRIKFVMPKKYQLAMEDGSVRYLIAGKGIDDNGKLFLNGNEILSLEGNNWQTEYTANINTYLKFGEENQLTVFINDSSLGGGIRFYITLIGDDMLAQKTPLEKPQMSALLWTYAVHGMSGIDIWHWDDDMVKTWLPEIKNSIDNVSEILLPRPRIKGKIAFFYSFETFRGLVNKFPEASDIMDYYGAMLFQQIPFDMLSGRKFLSSQNINSYPLIVIPYAELLRAGSFEKLKNYIADGGTAVLTYNSCEKEDYSYSKLPLDEFLGMERTGDASSNDQVLYKSQSFSLSPGGWSKKSGVYLKNKSAEVLAKYASGSPALLYKKNSKGSVYYIAAELDFTAVHTILRDILTREKISSPVIVHSENTSEFPYIEAQIIGNENKFLLYLVNWGGTE
ncbi:MAG TPA: hypothetical protein DC049_15195, partial [Spirochaetia bacterium]|nr:hypothetical protein [Spirochaetia bacterium]